MAIHTNTHLFPEASLFVPLAVSHFPLSPPFSLSFLLWSHHLLSLHSPYITYLCLLSLPAIYLFIFLSFPLSHSFPLTYSLLSSSKFPFLSLLFCFLPFHFYFHLLFPILFLFSSLPPFICYLLSVFPFLFSHISALPTNPF